MTTTEITEAELEAGIAEAIKRAFPFLPPETVKHQLVFNVRLGHKTTSIDGKRASKASGRCDVLLVRNDKPLAILELKRPGLALTDDDRDQGLSYAKLTKPWAPIVILTNGEETVLYSTFSGDEWQPESSSEEAFAALMASTAKIAKNDIRRAVQTLIGPQSSAWVGLVRSITHTAIDDLTGPADDPLLPFAKEVYFPRRASGLVSDYVAQGTRCVIVTGRPLAGKSNVLRGFISSVDSSENVAALFFDTSSTGQGILQTLANAMTEEFGWGVTKDEVRNWLIQISKADDGPRLVLVIDGIGATIVRSELDELVSGSFGHQLQLVLAVDDVAVENLTRNARRSQLTRFGKVSKIVVVETLDNCEFDIAQKTLSHLRIGFMDGAHRAPEYRRPWVLRWIAADAMRAREYGDEMLHAAIPSMMGLTLIWETRERFANNPELVGRYTTLAEAIIKDIDTLGRSAAFSLMSIASPILRLETARSQLGESEFCALMDQGYLKHAMLENNERIAVAQIPELLMTTLPIIVSRKLREELSDGIEQAAKNFVSRCGRLFAGDLIGAQAIVESATTSAGLPISFLEVLLRKPPRQEGFEPGGHMTGFIAEGIRADFLVLEDGNIQVTGPDGTRLLIESDGEDQLMMTDFTSWQILSHMAALPFAAQNRDDGSILGRLDPAILVEVGSCLQPVRPLPASGIDNVRQHDVPGGAVVCHTEGIIEPITYALLRAMLGDRDSAEHVIDEALSRQNLALLLRLYIALSQASKLRNGETSIWANDVLRKRIQPALSESGLIH